MKAKETEQLLQVDELAKSMVIRPLHSEQGVHFQMAQALAGLCN